MYDQCHCGAVKRNSSLRCGKCRSEYKARRMGHLKRPVVRFFQEWLSVDELRLVVETDMRDWKLSRQMIADKTGATVAALNNFLEGGTLPDEIAKYYGFRRANAWVRV